MNRIPLLLYNLFFFPLLLILLPGYLVRMLRRGGYRSKAAQRFTLFDRATLARIGAGRLWIHAASVGETGIALKFISAYRARHPDSRFLLSITTSTGLAIAEKHSSDYLEVIANPVDFPLLTTRLIRTFRPSALLFVEADLWPNRLHSARRLGIPVILLNARLSPLSERRFRAFRFFTAPVFNGLSMITITDPEDRDRWLSLGVRPALLQLAGNIKYDADTTPQPDSVSFPPGLGWTHQDPLFLAASTHDAEELEVARAYQRARRTVPDLRLVIAPRHVERRAAIVEGLRALGLTVALRSQEGTTTPQSCDVLLLDTTGELSRWYPLAAVVFVGKSLPCSVNHGGQNMIEPLQSGRPVLIGPHTGNFEPLASELCKAGAARRVSTADDIAESLLHLLNNPSQAGDTINAATSILARHRGATERTCQLVSKLCRAG